MGIFKKSLYSLSILSKILWWKIHYVVNVAKMYLDQMKPKNESIWK